MVAGVKACRNLPKERCALEDDTTIPPLHRPGSVIDPRTERVGGPDAPNLSPGTISRLTGEWQADHERRQRRDLSARRHVHVRAPPGRLRRDRLPGSGRRCLQARTEPRAGCMTVMTGATPEGRKQLVGVQVGLRESARSWRELPVDLAPPDIAAGDGAPGFRKALEAVVPSFGPRHQRGRTHKVSDIPNTIPKSIHPAVKADPREIRHAGTCAAAAAAADAFAET